jgi:hypothetical protein
MAGQEGSTSDFFNNPKDDIIDTSSNYYSNEYFNFESKLYSTVNPNSNLEFKILNSSTEDLFINAEFNNQESNVLEVYNSCKSILLLSNDFCVIEYNTYSSNPTLISTILFSYQDVNSNLINETFQIEVQ